MFKPTLDMECQADRRVLFTGFRWVLFKQIKYKEIKFAVLTPETASDIYLVCLLLSNGEYQLISMNVNNIIKRSFPFKLTERISQYGYPYTSLEKWETMVITATYEATADDVSCKVKAKFKPIVIEASKTIINNLQDRISDSSAPNSKVVRALKLHLQLQEEYLRKLQ